MRRSGCSRTTGRATYVSFAMFSSGPRLSVRMGGSAPTTCRSSRRPVALKRTRPISPSRSGALFSGSCAKPKATSHERRSSLGFRARSCTCDCGSTGSRLRTKARTMSTSELIGSSPQFAAVLQHVETVAPADCTVLIQGETGTGKELIAKAIHEASARRHHKFVAVNCGVIPASLLESELFGCERGAFTGAVTPRMGRFQAADRGTLFLDEIGDLPIELQPKLLRAIQEQAFERLGSSQATRVDVRIVAATNQHLEDLPA